MIQAAPGGHACNCYVCGPSDGTMFREDTTVYGGAQRLRHDRRRRRTDAVAELGFVGAPRNVDVPGDAPLCVP